MHQIKRKRRETVKAKIVTITKAIKKAKKKKASINDPLPKIYNTRPGESSFQYWKRTGKNPDKIKK